MNNRITLYLLVSFIQGNIQQRINRGLITLNKFPREKSRRRRLRKEIEHQALKETSLNSEINSQNFFTDMDDLRQKISVGKIPKTISPTKHRTLMEKLFPPFVSPKQIKRPTESYGSKFSPPLFPVDKQNPVPTFFAGKEQYCPLPTPLPTNEEYARALLSSSQGREGSNLELYLPRTDS